MQPLSSAALPLTLIQAGCVGLFKGKSSAAAAWELSFPGCKAAGVPEALPDGKVYPGLDQLGSTKECKNESVWPLCLNPNASG